MTTGARATPTPPTPPGEVDRHAWVVFSVTSLGVLLTGLNASTLDVALPSVVRHFSASATAATWILLSFLLVTTVLVVPFGRLADIIGRRRLYLTGLGLLTGASLVAGAAPDVGVLILARIAQAVGAASIMANVTAILTDAFRPSKLSIGLGSNVTVAAVGLVAGPAVGGLVADGLDWRWSSGSTSRSGSSACSGPYRRCANCPARVPASPSMSSARCCRRSSSARS